MSLTGGRANATYRLLRAPSLNHRMWSDVDTQTPMPAARAIDGSTPPAGQAFYRAVTP